MAIASTENTVQEETTAEMRDLQRVVMELRGEM